MYYVKFKILLKREKIGDKEFKKWHRFVRVFENFDDLATFILANIRAFEIVELKIKRVKPK